MLRSQQSLCSQQARLLALHDADRCSPAGVGLDHGAGVGEGSVALAAATLMHGCLLPMK